MKRRKNDLIQLTILVLLGASVILSLVLPQLAQQQSEPQILSVSILIRDTDSSLWTNTRLGMEQAADELGAELRFLTLSAPNDASEQESLLQREMEGGADAAVIVPADPAALDVALTASPPSCPIVSMESPLKAAAGIVAPDPALLGENLAQALLEDWTAGPVLLLDTGGGINHSITARLEAAQSPQGTEKIEIKKTPEIMKRMQSVFDTRINKKAILSPSALNTYIDCNLKFYYKYVALLTAPDEVSTEIDSAKFGSIFHYAAEHIYKDLTAHGKVIDCNSLEKLLQNDVKLQEYVDNGFKELFFNIPLTERPEYNGLQLINSAVILRYIKQLLRNDLRYAPFTFTASEKFVDEEIDIKTPKGIIKSRIGGIIDRMDTKDNTLRIVDYKTGGDAQCPPNIESLFIQDKKRSNYIFQTFMYASIVCKKLREKNNQLKVAPSLLYIHKAASENYSPVVQMGEARNRDNVDDFSIHEEDFRGRLNTLLEEIFNPETSFSQTEVEDKCQYCDYKDLCKK